MPRRQPGEAELDHELTELAELLRQANGPGLRVLSFVGAQADQLLMRLPSSVRQGLGEASEQALTLALRQSTGRRMLPSLSPRGERLVGAALGAVGGAGGVAGTLAELPVTTVFLLRLIQQEAARNGFDPGNHSVQFDSIRVFSAPGPFGDNTAETGYLFARLGLASGGMQKLVAQVAPKLGVALGQKLAAQAVPVIGGAAGASFNYLYARYYQTIAKVHFTVRRFAVDCAIPEHELMDHLQQRLVLGDR